MILLGAVTVTVERPGAAVFSAGELTDGPATTFDIRASVQPLRGVERQDLPEGYRTRGRFKMYTDTAPLLQTTNLDTGQREDTVLYNGRRFEVISWLDWSDHTVVTGHQKYLLAELGVDEQ